MALRYAEKLLLRLSSEGSLIHRRLRALHFRHPWRSAGTLLLRFRHFRHPWRSRLLLLSTVLLSGCAYFGAQARMQQFDDFARAYAKAVTWSNFEMAYSATQSAGKAPQADVVAFQNIKVTSYDLASQKAAPDGMTVKRVAQIRYVHTSRMVEHSLTVEEEWTYSNEEKRWVLQSGFPQFR